MCALETDAEEEYGIGSFVYEAREPFDYDRFMEFIGKDYPEESREAISARLAGCAVRMYSM